MHTSRELCIQSVVSFDTSPSLYSIALFVKRVIHTIGSFPRYLPLVVHGSSRELCVQSVVSFSTSTSLYSIAIFVKRVILTISSLASVTISLNMVALESSFATSPSLYIIALFVKRFIHTIGSLSSYHPLVVHVSSRELQSVDSFATSPTLYSIAIFVKRDILTINSLAITLSLNMVEHTPQRTHFPFLLDMMVFYGYDLELSSSYMHPLYTYIVDVHVYMYRYAETVI